MSIPNVSLRRLAHRDNAEAYRNEVATLASACSDWGFAYLDDLEDTSILDEILQTASTFFAIPPEEKMKLAMRKYRPENSNRYRGFFPTAAGSHALKEGVDFGWQSYEPTDSEYFFDCSSELPPCEYTKGWSDIVNRYYANQLDIGRVLLQAFESHFDLEAGYFTSKFKNTLSTLRFLHYPVIDGQTDTSGLECDEGEYFTTPAHTDSGVVTLLLQDQSGGLQVRNSNGAWTDVAPIAGSLIMNIGNLLERWTNGEFKATEHRVRAPKTSRLSVPFFFEPEGKAKIEPFSGTGSFEPITYEAYLAERLKGFVEYQDLDL